MQGRRVLLTASPNIALTNGRVQTSHFCKTAFLSVGADALIGLSVLVSGNL